MRARRVERRGRAGPADMTGARIITRLQWRTAACIGGGVLLGVVAAFLAVMADLPGTRLGWAFFLPHALGVGAGLAMGARQVSVIRRARRASFRLCDNCLYPSAGLRVCPECGCDVSDVERRWRSSVGEWRG